MSINTTQGTMLRFHCAGTSQLLLWVQDGNLKAPAPTSQLNHTTQLWNIELLITADQERHGTKLQCLAPAQLCGPNVFSDIATIGVQGVVK